MDKENAHYMNQWINFKELREQLDFAAVVRYYKVELKLKGDQHHGFCPLPTHNGKRNSPSFSANVKKGIWQCFGCGAKGNILDFAVLMEGGNPKSGEDVQRIALKLKEQLLGATAPVAKREEKGDADENTIINAPLDFTLKGLDANHPYLRKRGFSADTIARFGLGYCSRGLLKDRIAIPLHDHAGKLVGYAGRVIDDGMISEEEPKYRFPGTREREGRTYEFRKSLFLYNGHQITAPVNDLAVVEGFASVWWLSQCGIGNAVGTMGAACSEEQAKLIVSLVAPAGRIWICPDGDKAGIRCAETLLALLSPHRFVRWVKLEPDKQPTTFSTSELKERFAF